MNTDTGERVAIKILDKEKIQKQNMGAQIKKEVRRVGPRLAPAREVRARRAPRAPGGARPRERKGMELRVRGCRAATGPRPHAGDRRA